MPVYTGIIRDGKLGFVPGHKENMVKWYGKREGQWIKFDLSLYAQHEDPKTAEQLGYYWGLLLPEIHAQLKADGHTVTVTACGITREVPITREASHEIITELCGRIGKDGELMRLSECDLIHCIAFINNVLDFAGELAMDTEKLRAQRPKNI